MKRKWKGFMALFLVLTLCLGVCNTEKLSAEASDNLIVNGNFDDAGQLEVWNGGGHQGDAVITAEVSETPIGEDGIMTYGKITGRSSNYQCFAQDVTDRIEKNQAYTYSFYIMLDAEEYKDAPAAQRTVEISPHVRVNGTDRYSEWVSGTVQQVLEPGVWTKFTGTFLPSWSGEAELVVLRFLEQGTNYGQGAGVMGTYYLTGVELCEVEEEPELIQKDIVDLKSAVNEALGTDDSFVVGVSIVYTEISDVELMGLVTKHFNSITLGNELKPDAMFGYAVANPVTETVTFRGEELLVPVLDFSRAELALDYICKWNNRHPEDTIKVRGHVLLWHSQTPEWFFHEDYDLGKSLVSAETMTKRLEWYIASVAEHFNGESSKYKDLFYAWDVVNEAVSDNTGTYRKTKEKSRWWEIYQSNEFIIQAFRFANQYMPEDIDLYYNDYGDCSEKKSEGIVQLLTDVKNAEGTKIDGMGMQGHYQTEGDPTPDAFEKAVRKYAAVVDQIQITEWDMAVSRGYDGTPEETQAEYIWQAKRYHGLYERIQKLRAEGINVTGMTFWGVIDPNSWLQKPNSVGGASDGTLAQVPLLFDGDYQAKPSFWAFADEATYQKLIVPTPTPVPTVTPTPTVVPTVTAAPEPTEAPELPSEIPVMPTEPAQTVNVLPLLLIVMILAAAVGVVVWKRKQK